MTHAGGYDNCETFIFILCGSYFLYFALAGYGSYFFVFHLCSKICGLIKKCSGKLITRYFFNSRIIFHFGSIYYLTSVYIRLKNKGFLPCPHNIYRSGKSRRTRTYYYHINHMYSPSIIRSTPVLEKSPPELVSLQAAPVMTCIALTKTVLHTR